MMEDEVTMALEKTGATLPVVWMERGLHDVPAKLRSALQEEIDKWQHVSHILLAYGLCGNGTEGLTGHNAALVVPRFDDCLRILLAKHPDDPPAALGTCYYLTSGWINSDEFILSQFKRYQQKYGPKKADYIIRTMFTHYTGIRLIETGAYKLEDYRSKANEVAQWLNLELDVCSGCTRVLEKLVAGNWDEEFCILPPHSTLTEEHFLR
ncbi:MAG: DUF1638 domain-containing protein [Lachnospiraceae bacterium]